MYRMTRRELLVAGGMAALALAGCSTGGGSGRGQAPYSGNRYGAMNNYGPGVQFRATKPLTFSMMYDNNPGYPYNKGWLFWSELTKRTNVTLDPVIANLSDYNTKVSLLIGAGQAPVIIPKIYHPQEVPFIASGAILPVSDYTGLMPNYTRTITEWNLQPDIDTLRQADGKYYLLPGLHQQLWVDYTLAMRYDILAKLNLPSSWPELYGQKVPPTWSDVYDVLKAMKSYTNSYPLSDRWSIPTPGGNLLNILGTAYGAPGGWGYQNATWDYSAKKYVFTGTMNQWKQMLQFLNRLVMEGLLDPESFTQSDQQAIEKFGAGKSLVISTNAQTIVNDYRPAIKGIPGATVHKIPVPIGPMGPVNQGSRLENGIMILSKARNTSDFVAMMQFIDWLWYSPEGKVFAKWGIEGVTYTGSVDKGTFKLEPDIDWGGLNPGAPKNLQVAYGFFNGIFAYGGSTKLLDTQFPPEELAFQKVMNKRRTLPLPPPAPLTTAERQEAQLWETNLQDYVTTQSLRFILGKRSFSEWGEYVNELKQRNMTQYMDLITNAYERFKAHHG